MIKKESITDVTFQLVKDREPSDDIVQELLINIWIKRHSIRLHKPLSHYLITAALYRAKNHKRNRTRPKEIFTDNFQGFENTLLGIPADSSLEGNDIKKLWKMANAIMTPRTKVIFMLNRKCSK